MRNALVERHEGLESARYGVQQRAIVQISPAEIRRVTNVETNKLSLQSRWNARVEKHARRHRCHGLRSGNRFGEQRGLRHFENRDGVFSSHAREIHQEIVE